MHIIVCMALLVMPGWAELPEAYGSQFVYVCIRLSVCRQDFSSLAENQALKQATQAKVDICSKINCKNFHYKALFVSYGVICLPRFAGDLVFCEDNVSFDRIATCHLLHDSVALHSYVDLYPVKAIAARYCD